ncbi:MAG: hypothetical protein FD152_2411 [Xanthobacteraceae bacterium]|nr:MAG: hypothetical protein FD152_2411 [Xanthobacteraceae bacterium]
MSTAEALKAARAAGVELCLDGDDLVLEASAPPPAAVLDLLSRHKPGIVVLLRPGRDGWSAEDWQVFFNERAGIAEFDGGLPRPEAEARAFACCVVEWLNRNFVCSPPGRCLACGGGDHAHDVLLSPWHRAARPCLAAFALLPAWHAGRKAEAVAGPGGDGDRAATRVFRRFRKKRRRMMSGFGSGQPSGSWHDTVEACRLIDMNWLHRESCLHAGWMGGWQWTRDGEKVASINLRAEHNRVRLSYRVRGGEWEDMAETVRIVRITCRFGGARPYFICPGMVNGIACGRHVTKLHGPGRYFLCAGIAYRLAHASQSEGAWDRTLRRANKIRQRRGGDPGTAAPFFPPKPKGMWWRTHECLREHALVAALGAGGRAQAAGTDPPPEEHLVEELAGILWRKRRLRLAEAAAHRRGLDSTLTSYRETVKVALVHLDATDQSERVVDAIRTTAADTEDDVREMRDDEAMTRRALDLLGSRCNNDPYEAALAAQREDTRAWWAGPDMRSPAIPTNWRRTRNPPPPAPRARSVSSKARCCRGSRDARRNWRTAR